MDAEVPVQFVTQVSGHKNLKDLVSYKAATAEHQQKMSYILSLSGERRVQLYTREQLSSGNLSQAVNPNALFRMFSGAFIGKIEGCFFTFNIRHETKSP